MAKKRNVWKTLSILFIILFVLVIIAGLIKASRFRASFPIATLDQIILVKDLTLKDLSLKEPSASNYLFKSSDRIRNVPNSDIRTLEISYYNETARHVYIVNVDTGDIVMYSNTQFFDGQNHSLDEVREFRRPSPR